LQNRATHESTRRDAEAEEEDEDEDEDEDEMRMRMMKMKMKRKQVIQDRSCPQYRPQIQHQRKDETKQMQNHWKSWEGRSQEVVELHG